MKYLEVHNITQEPTSKIFQTNKFDITVHSLLYMQSDGKTEEEHNCPTIVFSRRETQVIGRNENSEKSYFLSVEA